MNHYDNVTFVFCLPRSRTAWLAYFLKPVAWTMHDPLKQCASIDELGEKVDAILTLHPHQPIVVVDTAAVLFHMQIAGRFPDARYVFVWRDPTDVLASINTAFKGEFPRDLLDRYNAAMVSAQSAVGARRDMKLNVRFDEIDKRARNIWRFVGGGGRLSQTYAHSMMLHNIQVPPATQRAGTDASKARRLFATIGVTIP